jgi:HK97 family phage major capsid protein
MNRQIILGAKVKMRQESLVKLLAEIDDMEERSAVILREAEEAQTEEEVDKADEDLAALEKELDEKKAEKEKLEQEIKELEDEIEKLNQKAPQPAAEAGERVQGGKMEIREALNQYIRSQGATRDGGLKIVDGGALIPTEVLAPQKVPTTDDHLVNLVNVVKVNSGSGKYPVIGKSGKKMSSVEELEKNPELAKPDINDVDYSIKTYRGYIPVSQELIDDADYDIMGLVGEEITDQDMNTKDVEIAKILKTATAKAAQGLDGLKDVINSIKSVYDVHLVVTDSLFAALDKVKDKNGRYMLQPDVTSPTGYKFAGRIIHKFEDKVMGENEGDMKAFIGDVKAFATLFDRVQASIKWTDNNIYGQLMASFVRFDTKKTDSKAGYYVTYTDAPA